MAVEQGESGVDFFSEACLKFGLGDQQRPPLLEIQRSAQIRLANEFQATSLCPL